MVGTHPDDPWVNVKLDVVENPTPDPNQRHMLHGGPKLRLPCQKCGGEQHLAAEKDAVEVLREAGIDYRGTPRDDMAVQAAVCSRCGAVTQLWKDMAERLLERRQ